MNKTNQRKGIKIMNKYVSKVVSGIVVKRNLLIEKVADKLRNNSGNWLEESMKYIAGVVIGLIVIAALVLLFKDTVLPALKTKVSDAFNIK